MRRCYSHSPGLQHVLSHLDFGIPSDLAEYPSSTSWLGPLRVWVLIGITHDSPRNSWHGANGATSAPVALVRWAASTMRQTLAIDERLLDALSVVGRVVLDADGRIDEVNPATTRLFELTSEELTGQTFESLLPAASLATWRSMWASPDDATQVPDLLHIQGRAAELRSVRCVVRRVPQGRVVMMAALTEEDVSLRRELIALNNDLANLIRENARKGRDLARALAELKQAQTMLVQREKLAALGQMTAGVAHEINNPLAFVTNNEAILQRDFEKLLEFVNAIGELLDDPTRLPPATRDHILERAAKAELPILAESIPRKLRDNREGLSRIRSIVQDLRAQTRLDEAEWKSCDLVPGLTATVRFLGPLCRDHGVLIETHFEDLGPVHCSPAALNQAVSIVLTNAVQASASGQHVLLSLQSQGNDVMIEISDQGAGMTAVHLGRVFEPFFTTKAVGEGMGLGLGIARQILDHHHGRIEIDSAVGEGTRVRLIIPRSDPPTEAA